MSVEYKMILRRFWKKIISDLSWQRDFLHSEDEYFIISGSFG